MINHAAFRAHRSPSRLSRRPPLFGDRFHRVIVEGALSGPPRRRQHSRRRCREPGALDGSGRLHGDSGIRRSRSVGRRARRRFRTWKIELATDGSVRPGRSVRLSSRCRARPGSTSIPRRQRHAPRSRVKPTISRSRGGSGRIEIGGRADVLLGNFPGTGNVEPRPSTPQCERDQHQRGRACSESAPAASTN